MTCYILLSKYLGIAHESVNLAKIKPESIMLELPCIYFIGFVVRVILSCVHISHVMYPLGIYFWISNVCHLVMCPLELSVKSPKSYSG